MAPRPRLGFSAQLTPRLPSFGLPTPPSGRPVGHGERRPAKRLRAHGGRVGRQPAGALGPPDPVPAAALLARPRPFPPPRPVPRLLGLLHARPHPLRPAQAPAAGPGSWGLSIPGAGPGPWGWGLGSPGVGPGPWGWSFGSLGAGPVSRGWGQALGEGLRQPRGGARALREQLNQDPGRR